MKYMFNSQRFAVGIAPIAAFLIAVLSVSVASAETSLGVVNEFYNPAGWSVGDLNSTYQEWDTKTASSGNTPDIGHQSNPAGLAMPTHDVKSPGFITGTSNFYSFSADYGATADIYNHGGFGAGYGTHVIVQTGSSLNGDTGNYMDTMKLVDAISGASITGGDNASALQISEISYTQGVSTSQGPVDYKELIYEFWLPNYSGDFRIDWNQSVHATIDTLRVDSMIAMVSNDNSPFPLTAVPEPATLGLLVSGLLFVVSGLASRRRCRQAS